MTLLKVVGVIVLLGLGGFAWVTSGLKKGRAVMVGDVDLANVPDGTYSGRYNFGRWTNSVEVVVQDHRMTDIRPVKDIQGASVIREKVAEKVLEKQSLSGIDTVSGATVTTKAFLKSIEDALKSGEAR